MLKWDLGRLIRRDYGAAGTGDRAWGRDWVCRSQEKEDRGQMTEDRCEMTEDRRQKTEVRRQKAENRRQRTEGEKVRWWERLLAVIIKQEESRVGYRAGLDQAATASCPTPKMVIRAVVGMDRPIRSNN